MSISDDEARRLAKWLKESFQGQGRKEAAEMLGAISSGSQMGPMGGWFHPGQSRYDWKWLAERHGVKPTDRLARTKFQGTEDQFARLDRNKDGELSSEDFDWSMFSSFSRQSMPANFWFQSINTKSNGRISRDEWQAFFDKIAKGKGYLTPDDLRDAFPTTPPSAPRDQTAAKKTQPSASVLLAGLLGGELGSLFEGPNIGEQAPEFALKTQDGKKEIRLSQFRGQRPIVLIFGSFT